MLATELLEDVHGFVKDGTLFPFNCEVDAIHVLSVPFIIGNGFTVKTVTI